MKFTLILISAFMFGAAVSAQNNMPQPNDYEMLQMMARPRNAQFQPITDELENNPSSSLPLMQLINGDIVVSDDGNTPLPDQRHHHRKPYYGRPYYAGVYGGMYPGYPGFGLPNYGPYGAFRPYSGYGR